MTWGLIGGAAIGLGGSYLLGQQQHDNAQDAMWSEHEMLNQLSGGRYGDYLSNYAYGSPQEQGQWAREMQSAMYPELTAYELAGSPSGAVSGALGANASSTADQTAGRAMQAKMNADNNKTQLQAAQMQQQTQLLTAGINAKTSLEMKEMDVGQSDKQLAQQQPVVDSQVLLNEASTSNIKMDTKVKDGIIELNKAQQRLTTAQADTEESAKSNMGRVAKDIEHGLTRLYNALVSDGNTPEASSSFLEQVTGYAKSAKGWVKSRFDIALRRDGVGGNMDGDEGTPTELIMRPSIDATGGAKNGSGKGLTRHPNVRY